MAVFDFVQKGTPVQLTVWPSVSASTQLSKGAIVGHSFLTVVEEVSHSQVRIVIPEAEQEKLNESLKSGQVIAFSVRDPQTKSKSTFYPYVESVVTGDDVVFVWLTFPEDFQFQYTQQRRNHNRVPTHLPVTIRYSDLEKWKTTHAVTHNLSGGGIRFVCQEKLKPGTAIRVNIPIDDYQVMNLLGTVVSQFENPIAGAMPIERWITAVSFNSLTPQQEQQLVKFCFQNEMKFRHLLE
ncbi:MAG: PilZ domain-containing protein [Cyanobacteria bacterium]|nr:PilZ domain-containing protein [Cyanobacteriota bacterium]